MAGNVLGPSKWLEIFEACQTGRKCSGYGKLAKNISGVPEWPEIVQWCDIARICSRHVTLLKKIWPCHMARIFPTSVTGYLGSQFQKKTWFFWCIFLNIFYLAFCVSQ